MKTKFERPEIKSPGGFAWRRFIRWAFYKWMPTSNNLRSAYPETELQLEYLHPEDVYDRVLNDAADLGLVSFPKDGGEIGCIPWLEQEIVLVVPPNHRLAGETWTPVSEIHGERFVGFTTELTIRRQIDRWLKQAKVSVHVVHEFDNIENIKRAVEIGSGIALLPAPAVRRECEGGSLWAVQLALDHHPPEDPLWSRPLGIVHKRHKTLSTAASKFVELLHEEPDSLPGNSSSTNAPITAKSPNNQAVS